jgi:hypothetical protein
MRQCVYGACAWEELAAGSFICAKLPIDVTEGEWLNLSIFNGVIMKSSRPCLYVRCGAVNEPGWGGMYKISN